MPGPGFDLIGEEEIAEVVEVLRAGHIYRYGAPDNPNFKAKVWQFEEAVARQAGVKHALALNSGTTALWVALLGLGIGPGDEVIVPGFTFIASIASIIYARAVPILAEVDRTFNLDPVDVERKITPRTKAIMVVHLMGNLARMDELRAIADRHNLRLIEDCAQAAAKAA
jgi:8-amino-3,8-dideoxy-alpha-D-manno-octulosonate transaminase